MAFKFTLRSAVGIAVACLVGSALAQSPSAPATNSLPTSPATEVLTTSVMACPETPSVPPLLPYGGPFCERPKLFGDWGGWREQQREHGITWDISSTNFYQGVIFGGIDQAYRYGGRGDYIANIDFEKLGFGKGTFLTLHGETIFGESVNFATGGLMPVSLGQAVPVPNGTVTALTGVKLTQFLSESMLVYGGKINLLDEFNQPFSGGARGTNGFMNAGLLIPPILARTLPYSTYGGGFALLRNLEPVFVVSAFDTNNTPTVMGFDTFFNNGVTVNAMATLPTDFNGKKGHYSIGGTYSTATYRTLDDLPYILGRFLQGDLPILPAKQGSWSVYTLMDQAIWVDGCDPSRSWGIFGHGGITDGNPNPIKWSAAMGIGGSNPWRFRKQDTFGVGYYYVGMSENIKSFAPRLVPIGDEHGVELFYNMAVTPWFHLTPDLQFQTPARDRFDPSLIFGLRGKVDF
jgi:porin